MNANMIINMILRIIMRKGINAGINKGMGAMRKRGQGGLNPPQNQMSAEEQAEFEEFQRQKRAQNNRQNTIERF